MGAVRDMEYRWVIGRAFAFAAPPPSPRPPTKDPTWHLVSACLVPASEGLGVMPYFLWARALRGRVREGCSACGALAVKEGKCLGCGRNRDA